MLNPPDRQIVTRWGIKAACIKASLFMQGAVTVDAALTALPGNEWQDIEPTGHGVDYC